LTRLRVLQEGRALAKKSIVHQSKKNGDTAYEMIDFFQAHKQQILSLAIDKKKLERLPTKRKHAPPQTQIKLTVPANRAKAKAVTIDDVDTFRAVKEIIKSEDSLSAEISEEQFKQGIQAIVGEPGQFKDWGGEKSDLFTSRIVINGKRLQAAFAFKGPGLKAKLVPGKMGKNGDQALRLFQEPAEAFFVQHWQSIDASVNALMQSLALAKSAMTGCTIFYGTIDGKDSERLRLAYPKKFGHPKLKKR
jgi:hypothetical protein